MVGQAADTQRHPNNMWGSSSGKKNAAAIRGLAPCHGSLAHHASSADSSCPGWGLGTLGPSHAQQGRRQQDVFDAGMQGGYALSPHVLLIARLFNLLSCKPNRPVHA